MFQFAHIGIAGGSVIAMPTFLAAGAGARSSGAGVTITPGYPAGIAAGQLLVLQTAANDATASSVSAVSGWTRAGTLGSSPSRQTIDWKIADGTESGTLNVTATGSVGIAARIYSFSNGSGIEACAGFNLSASSTTMTCQDVTTLGINRLAVQAFAAWTNTTIGNVTGETNADYTEAVAEYAGAAPAALLSLQSASAISAVAITGGSATLGAASTNRLTAGFAIIP